MTKMMRIRIGAIAVALAGTPALGQSINIDFGTLFGAPGADYAAAGLPGVWNAISSAPGVIVPLVGLDGQPVAATITRNLGALGGHDDAGTAGSDQMLMDDGILGLGDVMLGVVLDGLEPGRYEVTTYAWYPTYPEETTLVVLDDDWSHLRVAGGPWPGGLKEGVTHVVQQTQVIGGSLTIWAAGGIFGHSGFVNGIQLRKIRPADLNGDGVVDVMDLLALLAAWGPCDPPCPLGCVADINGDCSVDVLDLLELLASWD